MASSERLCKRTRNSKMVLCGVICVRASFHSQTRESHLWWRFNPNKEIMNTKLEKTGKKTFNAFFIVHSHKLRYDSKLANEIEIKINTKSRKKTRR